MPGVLDTFKVKLEKDRAYLVVLCFLKDSITDGNDGDKIIK